MRLREIMTTDVETIGVDEPARDAWRRMQGRRIRHLVVTEGDRIAGVVSDRDLGGKGGDPLRRGRRVGELMTPNVVTATPDMTLRQAANLMRGRLIGSLPVLEDDRLVGIVTATDVLDELGRGRTRPAVRSERPVVRLPAGPEHAGGRPVVRAPARPRKRTGRVRPRRPEDEGQPPFPVFVRATGLEVSPEDRAYILGRLGMKLGKFAGSIERVSVRFDDVNGPRGGVDRRCRVKVVLAGLPSVLVEAQELTAIAAVDVALDTVERTVRRALERRRTKPIRKLARGGRARAAER